MMLQISDTILKKGRINVYDESYHVFLGCDFREGTIIIEGEFKNPIFVSCRFLDCNLKIENISALSHCFIYDDFLNKEPIVDTDLLKIKELNSDWWRMAPQSYTEALREISP